MRPRDEVRVWTEPLVLPTYLPQAPDPNPMFLERRVYQGSSGRVYPLPFTDRIAETPVPHAWEAVWIENRYLRVLVLPGLGGRVHAAQDRTNGQDFLYRQPVIKPALVGLAGPWISGGIEFNWPQHHRPGTFLPVEWEAQRGDDGSWTIWCADHDPLTRMRGMHGICLYPGRNVLELKVRLHNRTPEVRTFLWWANAAAEVHEAYQSFFPGDVAHVADHARRATSTFPRATGRYYGVDYRGRARRGVPEEEWPRQYRPPHIAGGKGRGAGVPAYTADDLSFYANIPVPTSYMVARSRGAFFGGYDHRARAGFVHVANPHIAPGKKQWTWGNQEFGYAWDRNLTDPRPTGDCPPYIELMAGVYTDNQPDFSFLAPGETRTWTQCWYPYREIGPLVAATEEAGLSLERAAGRVRVRLSVTRPRGGLTVEFSQGGRRNRWKAGCAPAKPWTSRWVRAGRVDVPLTVEVSAGRGEKLVAWSSAESEPLPAPEPATEPLPAGKVATTDELYLIGVHLEQYRHATRSPADYWREAIRRDPGDSRSHVALGRWHMQRGEWETAEFHFRAAMGRLTSRNANPPDTEAWYQLGVCLVRQADAREPGNAGASLLVEAYATFYKATWNLAWAAPSFRAIGELDARMGRWTEADAHLASALRWDAMNTSVRNLRVMVLRRLGRDREAADLLRETRSLDPLDPWSRWLAHAQPRKSDRQTDLDVAHDLARAGLLREAVGLLTPWMTRPFQVGPPGLPPRDLGAAPQVAYTLGWLHLRLGDTPQARRSWRIASRLDPAFCFPARLEDIAVLEAAARCNPRDARVRLYLGNLLYDRRRHDEAIGRWREAVSIEPGLAQAWRNLGIGLFNVARDTGGARMAYDRAVACAPRDARVLHERDQLWKRIGTSPSDRLRELEARPDLVASRDDLSVELCGLHLQAGHPEAALRILSSRRFQPWEGGEGQVLGAYVRACLMIGRGRLAAGEPGQAVADFEAALHPPENLGEAAHLLANRAEVLLALGDALAALGERRAARGCWRRAARHQGDFQDMQVRSFSEMTVSSAVAWERLGDRARARALLRRLIAHARQARGEAVVIPYFATSLPTLLLFEDDLQERHGIRARYMEAQALLAMGRRAEGRRLLAGVLRRDPNHAGASDLLWQERLGKRSGSSR